MQALQFGQTCEERKSRDNSKHPVGPPLSRGSWDLPGTIAKSGPARDGTCLGFTSLPDVQTGVRLCPSGLAVLKTIFECSWLPSPGGSRGRVRTSKLPFRSRDLVFRPTSARIRREEYIYIYISWPAVGGPVGKAFVTPRSHFGSNRSTKLRLRPLGRPCRPSNGGLMKTSGSTCRGGRSRDGNRSATMATSVSLQRLRLKKS